MASSRIADDASLRLRTADDLVRVLEGHDRYIDLCIIFRRKLTQEYMYEVGGRWDRLKKCYTAEPPETAVYCDVDESQLELAQALGRWLEKRRSGDDARDLVLFAGGPRGGGKTFFMVFVLLAISLEVPGCLTWAISPTLGKREEIERTVRDWIPRTWRRYRGMPDCRFILANGSSLRSLSGEMLGKRGEAEAEFINEAQDHERIVFSRALPPLRKSGGLLALAGNPPDPEDESGNWTIDVKEGIDEGEIPGTYCEVDPRLNSHISQAAQDKIARTMRRVDPERAAVDIDGFWRRSGRYAYPAFLPRPTTHRDGGHIGEPPDIGWVDVTRELTAKRTGRTNGYPVVAGVDFNKRPHLAAIFGRLYRRPDGIIVYHMVDEVIVQGNEHDLASAVIDRCGTHGWDPLELLIIADSSGAWQNVDRQRNGIYSHEMLRNHSLTVVPVARPLDPDAPSGAGRNPAVADSLMQMDGVYKANRCLISPRCTWLIESSRKCAARKNVGKLELDTRGEKRQYTHAPDAKRYLVWYFEPRRVSRPTPTVSGRREVLPRRL